MAFASLVRKAFSSFRAIHRDARQSFSHEGEDLILERLFDGRNDGFFVDVGAHHPTRFSNTYSLYLRGWCGVNIDPRPGFLEEFTRVRPRDINLNLAIGTESGELTYYEFNEPALNTLDPTLAANRDGLREYRVVHRRQLRVQPLHAVLREHLPSDRAIDFFTIDVEGLDLQVLESNDWDRYRPSAVVVELPESTRLSDVPSCAISHYLGDRGYRAESKLFRSVVYLLER